MKKNAIALAAVLGLAEVFKPRLPSMHFNPKHSKRIVIKDKLGRKRDVTVKYRMKS